MTCKAKWIGMAIFITLIMLSLLGCGIRDIKRGKQHAAINPIYCAGGEDCEVKWGRSIQWILQNSQWKIRMQTNEIIDTYRGDNTSAKTAFTINKIPLGSNRYQIVMSAACGNLFGCFPSPDKAQSSFYDFVNR